MTRVLKEPAAIAVSTMSAALTVRAPRVSTDAIKSFFIISPKLPPIAVLYTLYARACDPVLGFLKSTGQFSDDEIVDLVMHTCFDGLRSR